MRVAGRILIIVGGPGSGKDLLIRALHDLWSRHAIVVPKHTSRSRRPDDGAEMICPDDAGWDLDGCDVRYNNFDDEYGIKSLEVWEGLLTGSFQVLVVSNVSAINQLRAVFGQLVVLIYVHSELTSAEYSVREKVADENEAYVLKRTRKFWSAFEIFLANYATFDHVLIHAADPEDLYDQVFRLIRAYESNAIRSRETGCGALPALIDDSTR